MDMMIIVWSEWIHIHTSKAGFPFLMFNSWWSRWRTSATHHRYKDHPSWWSLKVSETKRGKDEFQSRGFPSFWSHFCWTHCPSTFQKDGKKISTCNNLSRKNRQLFANLSGEIIRFELLGCSNIWWSMLKWGEFDGPVGPRDYLKGRFGCHHLEWNQHDFQLIHDHQPLEGWQPPMPS